MSEKIIRNCGICHELIEMEIEEDEREKFSEVDGYHLKHCQRCIIDFLLKPIEEALVKFRMRLCDGTDEEVVDVKDPVDGKIYKGVSRKAPVEFTKDSLLINIQPIK
jgi:hypothetical protein